MLKITGEARVLASYKKTTANGHNITDLVLRFPTSVCIDKANKLYRHDEVRGFILSHDNVPSPNSDKLLTRINIIDSELRVNTWSDKISGKARSTPELFIKQWEVI